MKSSDVFPSNYLKAADLDGHEPTVTISHVETKEIGDDLKPILFFKGKDKGVVMNKTNWNAVVDITGREDSDDWPGHQVKLVTRKVEFQGKRVPAIRIEEPAGMAPREPEPVEDVDEDQIPF